MKTEIVQTIDGRYMLLVNGFQWGGTYDRSGAGDATFESTDEAIGAYRDAGNSDTVFYDAPAYRTYWFVTGEQKTTPKWKD